MVKTLYKYVVLLMSVQMSCLVFFGQMSVYAGHQKSVLSAVNSARQQGVPEAFLTRLLVYALDKQLGADHTVHILTILLEVREDQFPLGPFLDKIQEGLAKQIEPQKLEDGLNKRIGDYKFIRQLLKKKYVGFKIYSETDVTVIVESLDFGLTRHELRLLFNRAPNVTPAMLALAAKNKALLKQLEFEDSIIDDILFTGLKKNSFTPKWSLFFKVAAAAKRRGIPPSRIAEVAKDVLMQNGDLQQVLSELGFVSRDVKHGPHLKSPPNADEGKEN